MFSGVQPHTHGNTRACHAVGGGVKAGGFLERFVLQAKSFLSNLCLCFSLWWPTEWHLALSCRQASSWKPRHLLSRSAINHRSVCFTARRLRIVSVLLFFSEHYQNFGTSSYWCYFQIRRVALLLLNNCYRTHDCDQTWQCSDRYMAWKWNEMKWNEPDPSVT